MQRVLDPAQIEAFAQRSIPRIRLPDPQRVFAGRAARLRSLSAASAVEGYLQLMATVSEAQQLALAAQANDALPGALAQQVAQAGTHGMPLLPAVGWAREESWREILRELCGVIGAADGFPEAVGATARRLAELPERELESQADRLLSGAAQGVDAQGAPFVMAALQVYWVQRVCSLGFDQLATLNPGATAGLVCPLCGSLPVASIVRADKEYQGYRYLCCGLCATEWHLVRVTCSHCQSTAGIHYQSIEGGSSAIRAEACDPCHSYRKIFYQEHDPDVEAVADDLASLTLDLLMTEAGFQRASGNPLLWHSP
jgi:FdhE protein